VKRLALLLAAAASASAQQETLDLLDGETLYEHGWLFTAGWDYERREGMRERSHRVSDPLDQAREDHAWSVSGHFGLRNDVQLSLLIPYVSRTLRLNDPDGPDRLRADGLGDATVAAKWRFYRWDAPHIATNFALIGALDLPTGRDDARDHGRRLPHDLQPGSGSWDASVGAAVTHEPYRWRFNAAVLYTKNGSANRGVNHGDSFFAEIAAGNRFWLEPYPGPFMRFDGFLRFSCDRPDRIRGSRDRDSGGDLLTAGCTLAFRPKPILDFQITLEIPVWQRVRGRQLGTEVLVFFAFGVRF
jgi:hypothetical protein